MRKSVITLILITASLLLLAACNSVQAPPGADLVGTNWVLSSLNDQLPLPGTTVTLMLSADGNASGADGCNNYSTTYSTRRSNLSFAQPMAATMMACPEPVMDQATAYMEALAKTSEFTIQGNQLSLIDRRTVLATFVAESQALAGTTWEVIGYNNGREAVVSVMIGSAISARFDDQNQVNGNAGCNDYFGAYQTNADGIAIGPLGVTGKFCAAPAGVMEQEAEYLAALQSAATYRINGNRLEMRTASGAIAVQMTRSLGVELPPAPAPGVPTGRVTAPNGVNVRQGPGTNYPVIGLAPFGSEGEIVGRSVDGQWWVVAAPAAPGGTGWVSAEFVAVINADDVPVIAPPPVFVPPVSTPNATPTPAPPPTATPVPEIAFWADQTTIDQGQCTTLNWSVENVQAVWVYPQGEPYARYPRAGQGSEQVCPAATTTYEMLVQLRDGSTVVQQVTITVNPAAPQNPLADTLWEVTGYDNGLGAMAGPISGTRMIAGFSASNQIDGETGCNNYLGTYQVNGNNIAIGPLTAGQMACGQPTGIMEQETAYLAALQSAVTYSVNGNQLELRNSGGVAVVLFVRQ